MPTGKKAAAAAALVALAAGLAGADKAAPAPRTSGIDSTGMDRKVRPQDDLFRHVNGTWLEKTEIPAERARYGSFVVLADQAEANLRKIVEAAAEKPDGEEARKIGDLYASFVDEARADALGLKPIEGLLAKVAAVSDKAGLVKLLGELERVGVPGAFSVGVDTDAKQSDRYILYIGQGRLGLPDESYYRDDRFKAVREAFAKHVAKILQLAGKGGEAEAAEILGLETRLAKSHWDRVRSRDDTLTYNKKTRQELDALTPGLDWSAWFDALGAKKVGDVVVRQPDYLTAMAKALDEVPLAQWKTWLTFRVISNHARLLSKPFVDEQFDFYGRTLTGAKENRPRWKRGVMMAESAMGEALGRLYVDRHYPAESSRKMKTLVDNLIAAYRDDIESLDWMSSETKKKALAKLAKFTPKIGHPEKWRDYSGLEVRRDDLVGNAQRSQAFETDYELGKLGRAVDRAEWHMTPQTVNAYYNPGMNEIVFPAAILQPPFFDPNADDAVNYGGIGAVIGHEIGHGFDDQGSKYDGDGNMVNWWTESDRKEFEARAKNLVGQYNAFSPANTPGMHVNGELTLGENIGDLGGLTIAYKAYRRSLNGAEPAVIDGLTGDQRFFMGWAQVWRGKDREAEAKQRLTIDPHSPMEFRCNGVVRNVPAFYSAFGLKEGDKLWLPPEKRVKIW